jgi:acetyl esterase/lipase
VGFRDCCPAGSRISIANIKSSSTHSHPWVIAAGFLHRSRKNRKVDTTQLDMVRVSLGAFTATKVAMLIDISISSCLACPQYVAPGSSQWNMYAPASLLVNLGENLDHGAVAWSSAEDCLSLAVWTPADAHRASKFPVALFVTGGGGVTGGINIPSQLPSPWVSRSQKHIVVTINYRVNIFGSEAYSFPRGYWMKLIWFLFL